MPIGGEELLESGGENVCEVGLDIPANSTTLTVESPAMSWQKTASSPGRMSPSCVAFVSASTSVRVAPGCRTTGAVSSSFTSVGALSAGNDPTIHQLLPRLGVTLHRPLNRAAVHHGDGERQDRTLRMIEAPPVESSRPCARRRR